MPETPKICTRAFIHEVLYALTHVDRCTALILSVLVYPSRNALLEMFIARSLCDIVWAFFDRRGVRSDGALKTVNSKKSAFDSIEEHNCPCARLGTSCIHSGHDLAKCNCNLRYENPRAS